MSSVFPELNPCVSCGACCAFFQVAFYWGEGSDCEGGTVPTELVEDLPPYRRVMKGTNQPNPRCVALQGEIGKSVHCSIYAQRSTTCRAFPYSWANGEHHPDCDKARARWGLPPLEPPFALAQNPS
ncbi:YkgJ family cysteine cluster protein [Myxococcota bacterium]|nr:YkgJ family cysteine cluster protein [Myxococcota bacterium]